MDLLYVFIFLFPFGGAVVAKRDYILKFIIFL